MGGVIRLNKAMKMFRGDSEINALYHGGQEIWRKPSESVYPTAAVVPSDNILFVGSSDLGCLASATWSPTPHRFFNTMRGSYTGSMSNTWEGISVYGAGFAITYGRTDLSGIVSNAETGGYPGQNPFTDIEDYQALVIDTVDFPSVINNSEWYFPDADSYVSIRNAPTPYGIINNDDIVNSREFTARMKLVRSARAAGINKIYICSPWPRLPTDGSWEQDLSRWYNTIQSIEDWMQYSQDRLNYQIRRESLGGHVNIIPFHLIHKRIYEDIQAGLAPAEITDFRRLWANLDNMSSTPATTGSLPRHWYMQSFWGCYAINCLFAAIVYDIDPRTLPVTDGTFTVPANLATYFRSIAYDIKNSYGRAGRVRTNTGFAMTKINEGSLSDILGNKLLANITTAGATQAFTSGQVRSIFVVGDIRTPVDETEQGDYSVVSFTGGGTTSFLGVQVGPTSSNFVYNPNIPDVATNANWIGHDMYQDAPRKILIELRVTNPDLVPHYNASNYIIWNMLDVESNATDTTKFRFDSNFGAIGSGAPSTFPSYTSATAGVVPTFDLDEIIVTGRSALTGSERFDIFRYLSKKYQVSVIEPLFPDIEE